MRSALCLLIALGVVTVLGGSPPRFAHTMTSPSLIPDPTLVRVATHSFSSLATDLYWLRAIGASVTAKQPYEAKTIIQWADFVTDLEPRFIHAYFLGGLLGAMEMPDGTISNASEADALLRKGQLHRPDECRLAVYRSYLLVEASHSPKEAADALATAVRAPGNNCAPFVAPLAVRLYASSGSFDAANTFTQLLVESTQGDEQELFKNRLEAVKRERALQAVDAAAREFTTRFGEPPTDAATLVRAGLLDTSTLDAVGEPVVFINGEARVASGAPRFKPFKVAMPQ